MFIVGVLKIDQVGAFEGDGVGDSPIRVGKSYGSFSVTANSSSSSFPAVTPTTIPRMIRTTNTKQIVNRIKRFFFFSSSSGVGSR